MSERLTWGRVGRRAPPRRISLTHRHRDWLVGAAVVGAYVVAARFGINLSVAHGVVTPVWAPSGIALAALLLFGRGLWPAVFLGAFVANATSGADPLVAAGIAFGNTLEAVAGVWLLQRVAFRIDLERVRDAVALVTAAGLCTLVAATNGVTVLSVAGDRVGSYGSDWLLWWFGDATGILLVAPTLLVAFAAQRSGRWPGLREALLILGLLVGVSAYVFLGGGWRYPYLVFPLLLWAVLRFRQLGAALSSFVVGVTATVGTMSGEVPIAEANGTTRVQIIQALVGLLAISLLVVGATLAERETADAALRETAERLAEAQALTHIGSFEWEPATDRIDGSDELYRILGLAPGSAALTYEGFLHRAHPDDRAYVLERLRRAYDERLRFGLEYRLIGSDGDLRNVAARGRVLEEPSRPARMVGTVQDVTEQRQAENLRDDILSAVSHELRTPLASILGFSVILRARAAELGEGVVAELGDRIVTQARRLERILSDLLDVDRLHHGLVLPEREPTDVGRLVEQLAAAHASADHAISVNAKPVRANVDATKVERMVDNLLANAVRHTPPGASIALRVEAYDDDLLIVVDDDGPGVPDQLKTAVFEIFDRGTAASSETPGMGIGLTLVGRLAAVHGGRAWVEDSRSGGASFRVLLPDCVVGPHS